MRSCEERAQGGRSRARSACCSCGALASAQNSMQIAVLQAWHAMSHLLQEKPVKLLQRCLTCGAVWKRLLVCASCCACADSAAYQRGSLWPNAFTAMPAGKVSSGIHQARECAARLAVGRPHCKATCLPLTCCCCQQLRNWLNLLYAPLAIQLKPRH